MNVLGAGQYGETRVPKQRAVLKLLILLHLWPYPVASSGLTQEGKAFRTGWNGFWLEGWRRTEGKVGQCGHV